MIIQNKSPAIWWRERPHLPPWPMGAYEWVLTCDSFALFVVYAQDYQNLLPTSVAFLLYWHYKIFFYRPEVPRGFIFNYMLFPPLLFFSLEVKGFFKGFIPYSVPLKNWANLTYVEGFFSIKKRYDRIFIIFQNLQQQYIMFLWCGDRRFNSLGIDT